MALYSKESIEILRQRIDLSEIIASYIPLKRSGAAYTGLCPFHVEKTASFTVRKGDSHYHCFGCGAHGDAIHFLMEYRKLSFVEALEMLSERVQVPLERVEGEEIDAHNRPRLRELLARASLWCHFFLLHSEEATAALSYLFSRNISKSFIETFEIGYVPKHGKILHTLLQKEGFTKKELYSVGLLKNEEDFFVDRIMFPICDRMGHVIGFSARKFREETFGGKYINTPGTPLFKKSQVLFGLCYSRRRIAKERRVLLVEGQIDALRLIHEGVDFTIAALGTAFGEEHVRELVQLGVEKAFLALDADLAGREATIKVGALFQEQGIEVVVVELPEDADPDSFVQQEGKEAFMQRLDQGKDFLSFVYHHLCREKDPSSPAQKHAIVEKMGEMIRTWKHPVMVHESLKRLSQIAEIPQEMLISVSVPHAYHFVRKQDSLVSLSIDPHRVLEVDILRWMLLSQEKSTWVRKVVMQNISQSAFRIPACLRLFLLCQELSCEDMQDRLLLLSRLDSGEEQELLQEIFKTPILLTKVEEGVQGSIHKLLVRQWMDEKALLFTRLQQVGLSDEEEMQLTAQFAALSKKEPVVMVS